MGSEVLQSVMEASCNGLKRPAEDWSFSANKRMAIEPKMTLYVSQNGNQDSDSKVNKLKKILLINLKAIFSIYFLYARLKS